MLQKQHNKDDTMISSLYPWDTNPNWGGGGPEGYVIFADLTFDINSSTNENNFIYLFSDEVSRGEQISKFLQEFTFRDKSLPFYFGISFGVWQDHSAKLMIRVFIIAKKYVLASKNTAGFFL